jgi:hypothetical protein
VKTQRQSATKVSRGNYRATEVGTKKQLLSTKTKLTKLYARLDQTKPGSKESKDIADEIIDAIG